MLGPPFAEIVAATRNRPSCAPVARQANQWLATFAEPMRVAVAGEIKCGKSTLVNALVGAGATVAASDVAQEQAMATGQLETTYVLTELVHGDRPGISVRYHDGSIAEAGLDRLHELTCAATSPIPPSSRSSASSRPSPRRCSSGSG